MIATPPLFGKESIRFGKEDSGRSQKGNIYFSPSVVET